MLILKPTKAGCAYSKAAEVFSELYGEITGRSLEICEKDDGVSDLIVIGADDVNDFCMRGFLKGNIKSFGIRYGTDDYCIRSYNDGHRRITILAGGRGRSTLYAVYDYFERFAGCSYFWDGDVIPKRDKIETDDFDIVEKPRFEFRGLRYFAHRGLKRFQAEHWGFDDWKRELDWMIKRRLNFFMLRIGMDDVWQRAFPDIVKYPDGYFDDTDKAGLLDRSDFWTLKYRGELREKILSYARDMDMDYPVDCGTLTHWYSPTPSAYLEGRKPSLLHEKDGMSDCDRVWNFLDKDVLEDYIKLTRTMVNEHEKRSDYFHTMGLGERYMSKDPEENFRLKIIAYRRVMETLRKYYHNSKLFVGAWDFTGFWRPEDVRELISELDPERTIILDYTAESKDPNNNFQSWNVIGKFPWIFGLFHAFCSDTELRGPYDLINERVKIAKNDPYCKGMVMWPELAHSDPIILEYLTRNSWAPLETSVEKMVEDFSNKRYGVLATEMNIVWQRMLPFIKLSDWGTFSKVTPEDENYVKYYGGYSNNTFWSRPIATVKSMLNNNRCAAYIKLRSDAAKECIDDVCKSIRELAKCDKIFENEFSKRDAIDLIRTAAGRFLDYLFASIVIGDKKNYDKKTEEYFILFNALKELIGSSNEFSLYSSLESLKLVAPTNPNFELTLKKNNGCYYNRTFVYELMDTVYRREAEAVFSRLKNVELGDGIDLSDIGTQIFNEYLSIPLSNLKPTGELSVTKAASDIASSIERIKEYL